jgi:hypothetical protein
MQAGGPPVLGVVPVTRDDAYTISRHTSQGKEVLKDLARERGVHVFNDGADLDVLEAKVWTEGTYQGRVGKGHRALFERFVWCSPLPIGRRIQAGKPDIPLYWVEIKGRIKQGRWVYHLVPRPKPASP